MQSLQEIRAIYKAAGATFASAYRMRIVLTARCPLTIDGVSIARFDVGRVYDVKESVAALLIEIRCAEPCKRERLEHPPSDRRPYTARSA